MFLMNFYGFGTMKGGQNNVEGWSDVGYFWYGRMEGCFLF